MTEVAGGRLEKPDAAGRASNPLCGDGIEIQLSINDAVIETACFDGEGCAVSQAASSLTTQLVRGKSVKEAERITCEELSRLLEIRPGPSRLKCVLLPLEALRAALEEFRKTRSPHDP